MNINLEKRRAEVEEFQKALLDWYDRQGRDIPWRYKGGAEADPYRVWLSEIMCQQTVVQAVIPYFLKFTELWPNVKALAEAPIEDVMKHWAGLGYYARARNLHKCAQTVAFEYGCVFPDTPAELKKLPGIGDYTAAAIAAIAFNVSAPVVDGNVERVLSRIHALHEPFPQSKPALKKLAEDYFSSGFERPGDLAQAFMDLGAGICIPASPRCALCAVSAFCRAKEEGLQNDLPRRVPKAEKPRKVGYVYLVRNGAGDILLERRPEKAMMGGMSAFPTSSWEVGWDNISHPDYLHVTPPRKAPAIRHSFTHFDLELKLYEAMSSSPVAIPENCYWVTPTELKEQGFPTLFKKAFKLWHDELIAPPARKAV